MWTIMLQSLTYNRYLYTVHYTHPNIQVENPDGAMLLALADLLIGYMLIWNVPFFYIIIIINFKITTKVLIAGVPM